MRQFQQGLNLIEKTFAGESKHFIPAGCYQVKNKDGSVLCEIPYKQSTIHAGGAKKVEGPEYMEVENVHVIYCAAAKAMGSQFTGEILGVLNGPQDLIGKQIISSATNAKDAREFCKLQLSHLVKDAVKAAKRDQVSVEALTLGPGMYSAPQNNNNAPTPTFQQQTPTCPSSP